MQAQQLKRKKVVLQLSKQSQDGMCGCPILVLLAAAVMTEMHFQPS